MWAQQDSSGVRERALGLFKDRVPDIEASEDMKVKFRKVRLGHLNDDKGLDAVVEFGLGAEKGNKATERRIAVYVQRAAGLEPVAGIQPDFCPKVLRIEGGTLYVRDLGSCLQPSPQGTVRYIWTGGGMKLKGRE